MRDVRSLPMAGSFMYMFAGRLGEAPPPGPTPGAGGEGVLDAFIPSVLPTGSGGAVPAQAPVAASPGALSPALSGAWPWGMLQQLVSWFSSLLALFSQYLKSGTGAALPAGGPAATASPAGDAPAQVVTGGAPPAANPASAAAADEDQPLASFPSHPLSYGVPRKAGHPLLPLLPPDSDESQFRKTLEETSGMPFGLFRKLFCAARNDWAVSTGEEVSRVSAQSIYKQLVVEQTFGPITMNDQEAGWGGGGTRYKVVGATNPEGADHNRANARVWTYKAYADLYEKSLQDAVSGGSGTQSAQGREYGFQAVAAGSGPAGTWLGAFSAGFSQAEDQYASAESYADKAREVMSPIVLDLDASGTPDVAGGDWKPHGNAQFDNAAKVHFDLDGDGRQELTEWVGAGDGLLAVDGNGNGKIDDGTELFGTAGGFQDGYGKLATLDLNRDGVLSGQELEGLRVWRDANSNGVSEESELHSLQELDITEISVNHGGDYQSTYTQGGRTRRSWDWWPTVERC